jgi:O-antigen ligase
MTGEFTPTADLIAYEPSNARLGDKYFSFLMVVLFGYAVIGRGFAYLGVSPLFIGEAAYLLGLLVAISSGCLLASITTFPSLALFCAMTWVTLRTAPFVSVYGFDALRDSVVIMYGGFAFIVACLLIEDSRRIQVAVDRYRWFIGVFVPVIPFVLIITRFFNEYIPTFPGYGFPILEVRPGEVSVHLAGAAIFCIVGLRTATITLVLFMILTVALILAFSRGAALAFFAPVVLATLAHGKIRQLARILVASAVVLGAALALGVGSATDDEAKSSEERAFSVQQITSNLGSILGYGGEQGEKTKEWRLDWWKIIENDTLYGDNFWTGRGFGINLADADGFQVGDQPDRPPLRSPHNVQMTILARTGAPGLALWAGFLLVWFGSMLGAAFHARSRDKEKWAGLFLFIAFYGVAFVINATFDVALEGPIQGIWFWCVIGFGIGSSLYYRYDVVRGRRQLKDILARAV